MSAPVKEVVTNAADCLTPLDPTAPSPPQRRNGLRD
jgi:hypothetical protein